MNHIDHDVLSSLKDVMEDDFSLLLKTFIHDSTERIEKLQAIISSEDADAIRRAAHSFKGSSSNIGAIQLTTMCAALEKKSLAGNFVGIESDLEEIVKEFAEVKLLLKEYIN